MTSFDAEAGVLRVTHPALAVLATLAAEPTSPRLHDHGVAAPLSELRSAGLVGSFGVHPAVAPLAHAIGRSHRRVDLRAVDHGRQQRARAWLGPDDRERRLAVVGVVVDDPGSDHLGGGPPSTDDRAPETYELMADTPAMLPELLGELVGLGVSAAPPAEGVRRLDAATFDALVAAEHRVDPEAVHAAVGDDPGWAGAFADGLRGSGLRWRLTAGPDAHASAGDPTHLDLTVLDAGRSGLWLAEREGPTVVVRAVDAATVRAALRRLAG